MSKGNWRLLDFPSVCACALHVSRLYPFVEARHFPEAAQLCREALHGVQPFQVRTGSGCVLTQRQ